MVALRNPSFEAKTHWWRPGPLAPGQEVPSQIYAFLGQHSNFWPPEKVFKVVEKSIGKRVWSNGCFSSPKGP